MLNKVCTVWSHSSSHGAARAPGALRTRPFCATVAGREAGLTESGQLPAQPGSVGRGSGARSKCSIA